MHFDQFLTGRSLGTRILRFNHETKLTKTVPKIIQKFTVRPKGGGGGGRTISHTVRCLTILRSTVSHFYWDYKTQSQHSFCCHNSCHCHYTRERLSTAMGGFLGLNIVYTYAASGEVTGKQLDTAWSCTNLWSGVGILFSPVFSGTSCNS